MTAVLAAVGGRHRALWIAFHVGILCAGIAFAAFGSVPVIEVAGRQIAYVWGGFLIVGGIISLVGAIFRRWTGEVVGLPFVMGGMLVYATALWVTLPDVLTRLGLATLLTALVIPLWIRWRDLDAQGGMEMEIARS